MEALRYIPVEADRFVAEGRPAAADLIVREALSRNPRDAEAWAALARVAAAVGETESAEHYARVARELAPAAVAAASGPERYLLIKAWGYGFCSDLDHVLGALLLCEITGRIPVTHWGANSLFGDDPRKDAFREFFEPLSPFTVDDLAGKVLDFWPPKWRESNLQAERVQKQWGDFSRISSLEMLNRPERVVVSDYHSGVPVLAPWIRPGHPMRGRSVEEIYVYLAAKYLRPRAEIVRQVDEFAAKNFGSRPVIAAHIRGGDKHLEDPQLQQKLAVYPQAIDHLAQGNPNARVFLLTDAAPVISEYQRRYGARLITTDCLRTSTQQGLHYQAHADRRRLGVEVLRDICLAVRCDKFVGIGSSNVSCMIHHMKPGGWAPGTMAMIGPMMTSKAEPFLYMSFEQLERYIGPERVASWRQNLV